MRVHPFIDRFTKLRMFRIGATQVFLLGPSLALTIAAFIFLSISQYATWGLFFALGSAAIILDLGAFQLAQIYCAESPLTGREMIRLLGLASVLPLILTISTTVGWQAVDNALLAKHGTGGPLFAFTIGIGSLLRAWQNVLNGVIIAHGHDRIRFRAASAAAVPVLVGIVLLPFVPSLFVLALAYLVGAIVGIVFLVQIAFKFGAGSPRGTSSVPTRALITSLSVVLTQGDRILVGLLGSVSGLAAYDFASRIVTSTKLLVMLLSTGVVTDGSRAAAGHVKAEVAERARRRTQHYVDRITLVAFIFCPIVVTILALVGQPSLALRAAIISVILAVGHGINAATAPATAFMSGMRFVKPELRYQLIAVSILFVTAPLLGQNFGAIGIALSLTVALASASLWLRFRAHRWIGERLQSSPVSQASPELDDHKNVPSLKS